VQCHTSIVSHQRRSSKKWIHLKINKRNTFIIHQNTAKTKNIFQWKIIPILLLLDSWIISAINRCASNNMNSNNTNNKSKSPHKMTQTCIPTLIQFHQLLHLWPPIFMDLLHTIEVNLYNRLNALCFQLFRIICMILSPLSKFLL